MSLPAHLVCCIERRLAEFLTNRVDFGPIVQKFGGLPLILDMGGCYALRPDGEVVTFAWDEPHDCKVEQDPRLRNMALFQGAKKYPELAPLVPPRQADAVDCSHCRGTGRFPTGDVPIDNVICYCGGLGWIPAPMGWPKPPNSPMVR